MALLNPVLSLMVAEARQRLEEAHKKQIKAKGQTMKARFKCLPNYSVG
jgi:hypothetical protein